MKIGQTQQQPGPALAHTERLRPAGNGAGAHQGVVKSADSNAAARRAAGAAVSVSAGARAGPQRSAADVDCARVDALRAAIEQRRFAVNPDAIADKLLAHARALLGSQRS